MEAVGGTLCNTRTNSILVNELTSSRDATIFQGQSSLSSGQDLFMVGRTKNGIRRGLLAFDIREGDFPSDAKVECAEIRLHASAAVASGNNIGRSTMHRITTPWTTSGSNVLHGVNGGNARTGDATWTHSVYPTAEWNMKGGDYDESNVVATRVGGAGMEIHSYGNTLNMARIVQEWIEVGKTNSVNAGFMLIGDESTNYSHTAETYVKYSGAENAPSLIPRLIVTYTSPTQGKEHRHYTAYLPEVPTIVNDAKDTADTLNKNTNSEDVEAYDNDNNAGYVNQNRPAPSPTAPKQSSINSGTTASTTNGNGNGGMDMNMNATNAALLSGLVFCIFGCVGGAAIAIACMRKKEKKKAVKKFVSEGNDPEDESRIVCE